MPSRARVPKRAGHREPRSLEALLLKGRATLLEAMAVIDREGIELAFVAKPNGIILGTVSDGDIRRAILRGVPLDQPVIEQVMNPRFTWVSTQAGRAEVLDRMRALGISAIPVLDGQRRMTGLHLLYELIGASLKPNAAVIMAGGKGTRLRPLTYDIPKPMIPVAGRPILERLVLQLVGSGVRDIYLSVNYLGHVIEDHFGDGARFGCRVHYLREKKPLGTAGSLSLLPQAARQHDLLVMNGDIVTEFDVAHLLEFHSAGAFGFTTALKPYQVEIPFGVADVQGDDLVGLREKPMEQVLVNAGIYVLAPAVAAMIPRAEFSMPDVITKAREAGHRIGGYQLRGEWIDVGLPETLKKARGH